MNLTDTIRGALPSDASNKAATALGESEAATHRGLQAAVPTILAGLAQRASTPDGASTVHDLLKESATSGSVEKITGGGDTREVEDRGRSLIGKIFGDRSGSAGDALAKSSGVKSESASRILSLAAPLVMGVLGKQVMSRGVSAGGVSQLLATHKNAILEDPHAPSGLAGVLGRRDQPPAGRRKPLRWGSIVAAFAALALALWGISAVMHARAPRTGVTARQLIGPTVLRPTPTATAPTQTGTQTVGVPLTGRKMLQVPANSPEADLAHTLADTSVPLPRTFRFGNLNFDPGSTMPAAGGNETIDSVGAILQSRPTAHVKVRGLSDPHARTLKSMLLAKGASGNQVDATGGQPGQNGPAEIVLVKR
jgi:hypothetical protein